MKKLYHLTQAGIDELQSELEVLRVERVETAEAIKVARELGDLAENAEYQTARQEQERKTCIKDPPLIGIEEPPLLAKPCEAEPRGRGFPA